MSLGENIYNEISFFHNKPDERKKCMNHRDLIFSVIVFIKLNPGGNL